jgi:hypothetical protein
MSPYWLLFLLPSLLALAHAAPNRRFHAQWGAEWYAVFMVLVLAIGLRHEVGGDWVAYLEHLDLGYSSTFSQALDGKDPAYSLLNWLAAQIGGSVHLVNTVCAAIFTGGLIAFCRMQPRPWLALVVAMPYLVVVVAMGYTRQATAIGIVLFGLVALARGQTLRFMLWVALAATFHKSAVILVPLALLAGSKRRGLTVLWVLLVGAALFALLLEESVEALSRNYLEAEYQSQGAGVRVAMNALPAAIFLFWRRHFDLLPSQRMFWTWMSAGALLFIVLLAVSPSSTAVDRVALYWIPLQIFVWSRVPNALGRPRGTNADWVWFVVAYSGAVLFVWLVFGSFSYTWLPYRFLPFELLREAW